MNTVELPGMSFNMGGDKKKSPLVKVVMGNDKIAFGYDEFNQFMMVEFNDRGWSMSPARDLIGMECYICRRKWTNDDPYALAGNVCIDDPRWSDKAGPDGKHQKLKEGVYAHGACWIGHLNINEKSVIEGAIGKAREAIQRVIDPTYKISRVRIPYEITAIPNEYGRAWNTDWYSIKLPKSDPVSQIKFGSRKRVWVVELSSEKKLVIPEGHPLDVLYKKEQSTKTMEPKLVMFHAWSEDKVREYVEAMLHLVSKPEPVEK